jgi:hypothetical protein
VTELAYGRRAAACHHPAGLGDVTLRSIYGDRGQVAAVEVLHADPRVLISGEVLRQIHDGKPEETVPFAGADHPGVGGVLRIHAVNRTLVYRIASDAPVADGYEMPDAYIGEWPD